MFILGLCPSALQCGPQCGHHGQSWAGICPLGMWGLVFTRPPPPGQCGLQWIQVGELRGVWEWTCRLVFAVASGEGAGTQHLEQRPAGRVGRKNRQSPYGTIISPVEGGALGCRASGWEMGAGVSHSGLEQGQQGMRPGLSVSPNLSSAGSPEAELGTRALVPSWLVTLRGQG